MTREFFERFLHVAQSEDDDSDEQDMEHEAQNILPVLAQLSIGGVNLQYDNLQGDVPQAGLATVGGPFATHQGPIPAPVQIATLETPQGSSSNSTDFQNPAANFGAGSTAVPNVPVSIAPVLFTIDLQEMAKSMGFIVVPAFP